MTANTPTTFGIELELSIPGKSRRAWSAKVAERLGWGFWTGEKVSFVGGDESDAFRVVADQTVGPAKGRKDAEVVSPILTPGEVSTVVDVLEAAVAEGAGVTSTCGIHVHVGIARMGVRGVVRLALILAEHEAALFERLGIDTTRAKNWCRPMRPAVVESLRVLAAEMDAGLSESDALLSLSALWFGGAVDGEDIAKRSGKLHATRYAGLNLYSVFLRKTVEFRYFNGSAQSDVVEAYINFALALEGWACETGAFPAWEQIESILARVGVTPETAENDLETPEPEDSRALCSFDDWMVYNNIEDTLDVAAGGGRAVQDWVANEHEECENDPERTPNANCDDWIAQAHEWIRYKLNRSDVAEHINKASDLDELVERAQAPLKILAKTPHLIEDFTTDATWMVCFSDLSHKAVKALLAKHSETRTALSWEDVEDEPFVLRVAVFAGAVVEMLTFTMEQVAGVAPCVASLKVASTLEHIEQILEHGTFDAAPAPDFVSGTKPALAHDVDRPSPAWIASLADATTPAPYAVAWDGDRALVVFPLADGGWEWQSVEVPGDHELYGLSAGARALKPAKTLRALMDAVSELERGDYTPADISEALRQGERPAPNAQQVIKMHGNQAAPVELSSLEVLAWAGGKELVRYEDGAGDEWFVIVAVPQVEQYELGF